MRLGFDLDALVAQITDENRHGEVETGSPVGAEFGSSGEHAMRTRRIRGLSIPAPDQPSSVRSKRIVQIPATSSTSLSTRKRVTNNAADDRLWYCRPRAYNRRAELCVLCPITNQQKGYPFEVAIPAGHAVTGVVLSDQMKSLSWERRGAVLRCGAPAGVVRETKGKIMALLQIP